MKPDGKATVVIAGLGLIGGSMALALQKAGWNVTGIDLKEDTLLSAQAAGLCVSRPEEAREALKGAELLLLALPPIAALDFLEENASRLRPGTVVSDVCGVKRGVVAACNTVCRPLSLRFIGGHPMAGKEKSGFKNADADLFRGASYILTPLPDDDGEALGLLENLAKDLGCAHITITDPDHHDRMIAFTSQLPHVLAGAYVKSPVSLIHAGYSAGSYRDVSRVATVDESLWTQLFLMNQDYLCQEIDGLIRNLTLCRDAVAAGDKTSLEEILRAGRLRKEGIPD